tara:strand:- start:288 stop:698 length:411 start_codon:yes stop_codon:yes gene_type:complete
MNFAEQMRNIAVEAEAINTKREEETQEELEKRMELIRDEKYTFLTTKYFDTILRGITNAAKKGKRERYINFDRDDFKANCKGLGYPSQFQRAWLEELQKPDSKYLEEFQTGDNKVSLEGIEFDIWNNKAYTTVFKW